MCSGNRSDGGTLGHLVSEQIVPACRGLHQTRDILAAADEAGSQAGASRPNPPDLSVGSDDRGENRARRCRPQKPPSAKRALAAARAARTRDEILPASSSAIFSVPPKWVGIRHVTGNA
jgi:hypothetical protein